MHADGERLTPLPADRWGDREREALAGLLPERRRNPVGAGTALATLVRHPDLLATVLPFSAYLLTGSSLPARLRELAILRIAARRDCRYEWTHHQRIAAKAGLTGAEIAAAAEGRADGELDAAVLRAADELDLESRLTDPTWATLTAHLDEHQVIDLVFTVAGYALLAMAFNALGVQPEEGAH